MGLRCLITGGLIGLLCGCLTPAKEKQFRDDIQNLQARVIQLESYLQERDKNFKSVGDNVTQQIAATSTKMEKMSVELQKVKGDVDAMRVGITTGQFPGIDPSQEGSLTYTLNNLSERLTQVEADQEEILSAIRKASGGKKDKGAKNEDKAGKGKAESAEKKSPPLSTAQEVRKAFEARKFKKVAEDAPNVLKKVKNKSQKEDVTFVLAESLFKDGQLREAALRYNDFLEMKPGEKSNIPLAKMRLGDCFRQLGDKATAKIYYEELVANHPDSSEAGIAKDRLAKF